MHSYRRKIEIDMVSVTYLAASLLILVHPLEISGYAISRDLKLTPSSSPSLVASSENQQTGFDTKTIEKPVQAAHHVPLDTSSNRGTVSVVKREVNPSDGGGNNGLTYDPSMVRWNFKIVTLRKKLTVKTPLYWTFHVLTHLMFILFSIEQRRVVISPEKPLICAFGESLFLESKSF